LRDATAAAGREERAMAAQPTPAQIRRDGQWPFAMTERREE